MFNKQLMYNYRLAYFEVPDNVTKIVIINTTFAKFINFETIFQSLINSNTLF